jgi:hypothetical protein
MSFGNQQELEFAWAERATQHADEYSNLLKTTDPSKIRLTKYEKAFAST